MVAVVATGFLGQLGKYLVSLPVCHQPGLVGTTSHTAARFPGPAHHHYRGAGPAEWNILAGFYLKYFCKSGGSTLLRSKGSGRWTKKTVSDLITRLGNKAMISISSHKVTNSPNITHSSPRLHYTILHTAYFKVKLKLYHSKYILDFTLIKLYLRHFNHEKMTGVKINLLYHVNIFILVFTQHLRYEILICYIQILQVQSTHVTGPIIM